MSSLVPFKIEYLSYQEKVDLHKLLAHALKIKPIERLEADLLNKRIQEKIFVNGIFFLIP